MAEEFIKFEKFGMILIITQDYMRAFLIIKPDADPELITLDHLAELLMMARITYGVIDSAIQSILSHKNKSEKMLIAQGKSMKPEIWDRLEYHVECTPSVLPRVLVNQRKSFKDIHLIENVVYRQILVQRLKSSDGEEGRNICGMVIPQEADCIDLPQGDQTEVSTQNPHLLVASVNGHVFQKNGLVHVSSDYTIHGNIDYHTGKIIFLGNLIIEGDVKDGFEVKTGGNTLIKGLIEKADIDCGGDLWVEGGIIGSPHSQIKVKGDCRALYIENCRLQCHGTMTVEKYCYHSNLLVGKSIKVGRIEEGFGTIIGGELQITENLLCGNLGNLHNASTLIMLGINPFLRLKIEKAYHTINQLAEEQNRLQKEQDYITHFFEFGTPADSPFSIEDLQKKQATILLELTSIQKEIERKKQQFQQLEEAYTGHIAENREHSGRAEIYQTMFPGTVLNIRELEFRSPEPMNHFIFFDQDNKIEYRKLDDDGLW